MYAVEARHASGVRRSRGNFSETSPNKRWIGRNVNHIHGSESAYDGEECTTIRKIDLTALHGVALEDVTEAFSEPRTMQVLPAIVGHFIA